MELTDYQSRAMTTCMPSCDNFSYMMLNLVGEVGEFASKVAKSIRKEEVTIRSDQYVNDYCLRVRNEHVPVPAQTRNQHDEQMNELRKEAGDILWQLAGLCNVMGWTLEEVAQENLAKLASRQQRGVIDGNGDNR